MDHSMDIVKLAVVVIVVAVLVVAVFGLVNSGQSLLSTGKSQVNESLKNYGEVAYTQYDGAIVSGSQVISVIKTEWKANNTVSVNVCTMDGTNYSYDYSGMNYAIISGTNTSASGDATAIKGNFPNDCSGKTLMSTGSTLTKIDSSSTADVANKNTGYNEGCSNNASGSISRNANFKGSVHRDRNGNIRMLTFVQCS